MLRPFPHPVACCWDLLRPLARSFNLCNLTSSFIRASRTALLGLIILYSNIQIQSTRVFEKEDHEVIPT